MSEKVRDVVEFLVSSHHFRQAMCGRFNLYKERHSICKVLPADTILATIKHPLFRQGNLLHNPTPREPRSPHQANQRIPGFRHLSILAKIVKFPEVQDSAPDKFQSHFALVVRLADPYANIPSLAVNL